MWPGSSRPSTLGKQALSRAAFLYWAHLGQAIVMDPRHSSIAESAIDDIGDLFEQ
ncbi:MAG TPA: hypothetical protein VGZ72_04630 [Stellaceae bacterium]|jgi:hypothetical protein|nr:hypothetical protein [Stellaceae bacterium]